MKEPISDQIRLEHILDAIEEIHAYMKGRTIDDLYADSMLRSAIRYQLAVVGEAANNITEQSRQLFKDVEWRKIIDTRNVIIHGYALIDEEIIWNIIEEKLPELELAIREKDNV